MPGLSVVLPVRNMADTLSEQLDALSRQAEGTIDEVVIVDHASSDGSRRAAEEWQGRLPALRVVLAPRSVRVGQVRNIGVAEAKGDFLAFLDADDVIDAGWSVAMLDCFRTHRVIAGGIDLRRLNEPTAYDDPCWEQIPRFVGFMGSGIGGNMAMKRDLFEALGGFSADLKCGEDLDLCWKAQLRGDALGFAPKALVHRRLPVGVRALFTRQLKYSGSSPFLYRDFRHLGMGRRPTRDVVYDLAMIGLRLPTLHSPVGRRRWAMGAGKSIGFVIGSIRARTIYL